MALNKPIKQLMPQEIEVWYIIPAIRRELAKSIIAKGLKHREAAKILGITEAAVSQYLKLKRAKDVVFDQDTMHQIGSSAEIIVKDSTRLIIEMQKILESVRKSKVICQIHYKYGLNIQNCEACMKS
jgi:predicted transcriptional regulator